MYYCCDTVVIPETGVQAVQIMLLCTIAVALWGEPEAGRHAFQVMLLCTITVPLWGSLRLDVTLSR